MTAALPTAPFWAWPGLPGAVLATADHTELPDATPARSARQRRVFDHAAGRLAAARGLRALTGHARQVGRGADGAPLWPAGVVGAISHAQGRAVALVGLAAHHAGLGVDLERIARRDSLAPLILGPAERAWLDPDDALRVTLAFSAKEALFKALYPRVRRFFGFDAAELLSLGEGEGRLRLRVSLGPWSQHATFRFHWTEADGQVLTALSAAPIQARSVAPPST